MVDGRGRRAFSSPEPVQSQGYSKLWEEEIATVKAQATTREGLSLGQSGKGLHEVVLGSSVPFRQEVGLTLGPSSSLSRGTSPSFFPEFGDFLPPESLQPGGGTTSNKHRGSALLGRRGSDSFLAWSGHQSLGTGGGEEHDDSEPTSFHFSSFDKRVAENCFGFEDQPGGTTTESTTATTYEAPLGATSFGTPTTMGDFFYCPPHGSATTCVEPSIPSLPRLEDYPLTPPRSRSSSFSHRPSNSPSIFPSLSTPNFRNRQDQPPPPAPFLTPHFLDHHSAPLPFHSPADPWSATLSNPNLFSPSPSSPSSPSHSHGHGSRQSSPHRGQPTTHRSRSFSNRESPPSPPRLQASPTPRKTSPPRTTIILNPKDVEAVAQLHDGRIPSEAQLAPTRGIDDESGEGTGGRAGLAPIINTGNVGNFVAQDGDWCCGICGFTVGFFTIPGPGEERKPADTESRIDCRTGEGGRSACDVSLTRTRSEA